jgi:hypothetical protein
MCHLLAKYNNTQTFLKVLRSPYTYFIVTILLIGFLIECPKLLMTFSVSFNKNLKNVCPDCYIVYPLQCQIQQIHSS